jgi:hypothetical protein
LSRSRLLLEDSGWLKILGIALLISGLTQINTLSFYHQHVIYDTASFVAHVQPFLPTVPVNGAWFNNKDSISIAGAFCCSFSVDMEHIKLRYALILIWTILYLTFTCLFAVNLNSWSFDEAGHCYNSSGIALRDSRHPHVDYLYITLTCLYVFLLADNHSSNQSSRERRPQYPRKSLLFAHPANKLRSFGSCHDSISTSHVHAFYTSS